MPPSILPLAQPVAQPLAQSLAQSTVHPLTSSAGRSEELIQPAEDCISLPLLEHTVCNAQPQPQHPEPAVRPVQLQLASPQAEISTPAQPPPITTPPSPVQPPEAAMPPPARTPVAATSPSSASPSAAATPPSSQQPAPAALPRPAQTESEVATPLDRPTQSELEVSALEGPAHPCAAEHPARQHPALEACCGSGRPPELQNCHRTTKTLHVMEENGDDFFD